MATYVTLNMLVLILLAGLVINTVQKLDRKPLLITLIILLLLTAVFDSFIIAVDLVAYDTSKILGVYIGRAPIEDFAYTVAAVLLVPYLWQRFKKNA